MLRRRKSVPLIEPINVVLRRVLVCLRKQGVVWRVETVSIFFEFIDEHGLEKFAEISEQALVVLLEVQEAFRVP